MIDKKLLFSVSKDTGLQINYFSGTGKGGQNRNKKQKCVRLHHIPSGTIVTATEERSKKQNERKALERLVDHPKFRTWTRLEAAAKLKGFKDLEDQIDKAMSPENLKIEIVKKENE